MLLRKLKTKELSIHISKIKSFFFSLSLLIEFLGGGGIGVFMCFNCWGKIWKIFIR